MAILEGKAGKVGLPALPSTNSCTHRGAGRKAVKLLLLPQPDPLTILMLTSQSRISGSPNRAGMRCKAVRDLWALEALT